MFVKCTLSTDLSTLKNFAAAASRTCQFKATPFRLRVPVNVIPSSGSAVSAALAALLVSFHIISGLQIVLVAIIIFIIITANQKLLLVHQDIIHSRSGIKLPSPTKLGISFICMVTLWQKVVWPIGVPSILRNLCMHPKKWLALAMQVFQLP